MTPRRLYNINREIIINSAYMYLVNLLPKHFRLPASSEVCKQYKVKTLS